MDNLNTVCSAVLKDTFRGAFLFLKYSFKFIFKRKDERVYYYLKPKKLKAKSCISWKLSLRTYFTQEQRQEPLFQSDLSKIGRSGEVTGYKNELGYPTHKQLFFLPVFEQKGLSLQN